MTTTSRPFSAGLPTEEIGTVQNDGAPRAGFGRRLLDLVASVVVAAATSLGLQWCVTRLNIPMPSYAPLALLTLSCMLLLALAVWLVSKRQWPRWAKPASWIGLSALGTLPLALLLQGTRYYLFGLSGDQLFRTQYLARLTESPGLADINYADLPPFYPAGWFWLGGRFANLFDLPGWAAYKPFALLTMAVTPVIAFALWSVLLRRPHALLVSVLTCLVGLRIAAYSPYSWLVAASVPPVAVIAWREFRSAVDARDRNWSSLVAVGGFVGVCGAVYTLHFGFSSLLLVAIAGAAVGGWIRRARAKGDQPGVAEVFRLTRRALTDLVIIGLISVPIVLSVWAPFLLRVVETGKFPSSGATRFLPKIGAMVPMPMFELSAVGFLCMAGIVWVVLAWRRSGTAKALAGLTVVCYAWYALSFMAVGFDTTLLAFRIKPILVTTLFCAGGLGVLDFLRWVWRKVPRRPAMTGVVVAVVASLGMVSLAQTAPDAERETITQAIFDVPYNTYYPSGVTPLGVVNPDDPGAWNDELLATINELNKRPANETVVLTAYYDIFAFRPYWGFQAGALQFANPFADFGKRRALIESWAESASSTALIDKLQASRYQPPDIFVLRIADDGLHVQVSRDTFPKKAGEFYDVVFPEVLFDGQAFTRREVGPFAVIAWQHRL